MLLTDLLIVESMIYAGQNGRNFKKKKKKKEKARGLLLCDTDSMAMIRPDVATSANDPPGTATSLRC